MNGTPERKALGWSLAGIAGVLLASLGWRIFDAILEDSKEKDVRITQIERRLSERDVFDAELRQLASGFEARLGGVERRQDNLIKVLSGQITQVIRKTPGHIEGKEQAFIP